MSYCIHKALVSSTNKISYVWIRNVGFNLYLHKKLIGVLVWWYRVIINSEYYRLKISKKKKKKKSSSNLPMRFLVIFREHVANSRHPNTFSLILLGKKKKKVIFCWPWFNFIQLFTLVPFSSFLFRRCLILQVLLLIMPDWLSLHSFSNVKNNTGQFDFVFF